jgi:hypothetical protein
MAWEPIDEDAATEDAQARSTITSFTEKPAHGAKTANAVASVPARKRATGAFDVSGRDYAEVRNVGTDVYASEDIGVLDDIEEEAMEGLAPARYGQAPPHSSFRAISPAFHFVFLRAVVVLLSRIGHAQNPSGHDSGSPQ